MTGRLQRLEHNYPVRGGRPCTALIGQDLGMRRTVDGVILVHDHGHPHVLLLQLGNGAAELAVARADSPGAFFKLCARRSSRAC